MPLLTRQVLWEVVPARPTGCSPCGTGGNGYPTSPPPVSPPPPSTSGLLVQEQDGSPSSTPAVLVFPNRSLSAAGSTTTVVFPTTPGMIIWPFAWGDASPAVIGTVPAGKLIIAVQLSVTTAFDGSAPALTVGPAGNPSELLAAAGNDPTTAGVYEATPNVRYGVDTDIRLSITPGAGASAGAGLVTVEYQP